MAKRDRATEWVQVSGENNRLVDLLSEAIELALVGRHRFYWVSVDSIGRSGEVLVSITGSMGHVPLCFPASQLDPANVSRVVRDTVSRFAL